MIDMRIGGTSLPSTRIAVTAADADGNPAGSQGGAWSFDTDPSNQNPRSAKSFSWVADGSPEARALNGDVYLTAMFEQYVNYRGPKRGTVDNPLAPSTVRTVAMNPAEGRIFDVRV
ncbi:hypothetical protein [Kineosporia succinea]|uniref:Uncharacterized protein n=1 Tax=Kineosporia succinea TaxID=84632 RepID=A0ABT9P660_9ACTN|nr:hypothetical protein [Kineosporia succinea]MDP9828176.1 hypothetical protein [Kineosporia succinea]